MSISSMANATARQLKDRWEKSVKATLPFIVESQDSDGNPVLTLSADATPAAGEKVVIVRVKPVSRATYLDSLGLATIPFSPHLIQICTESNSTGSGVADILTPVELLQIIADCASRGFVTEWYQSASGTVPATTQISSTTLKATWQPNLYQGFCAAQ